MIRSIARARSALMSGIGLRAVRHRRSASPRTISFRVMASPLVLLGPAAAHPSASQAEELAGLHAIRQPFDGDASARNCPNRGTGQAVGIRRDENRAGACSLLEAGGDVRRQPDGAVIATEIAANRADNYLAGGDAHAN